MNLKLLIKKFSKKYADILKIDTQGSGLDVLKGGMRVFRGVIAVKCEVEFIPFYKNQPLFPEIVSWMDKHGFTLNKIFDYDGEEKIGRQKRIGMEPVWCDCLFVKTN